MTTLSIGAETDRDVINAKAQAAMAEARYPLNVTLKNETGRMLILPEVQLRLAPASRQTMAIDDERKLTRIVSSLAQIAHLTKTSPLVTLTLDGVSEPAPTPEPAPKPAPSPTQAPAPAPAAVTPELTEPTVTVVQDDDEHFIVELDGVRFEPNRNQVRDDGTLTAGGKKALADAQAKQRAN